MLIQPKEQLRKKLIESRDNLSNEYRGNESRRVCERLIDFSPFRKATMIAFYKAMRSEVDLELAMQWAWQEGKIIVLPRVIASDGSMDFYKIGVDTQLTKGSCGSFEPPVIEENKVAFDQIELIVVPGVGFDEKGYRLGYGGGYYDRLFSRSDVNIYRVGIAFVEQIVPTVYPEEHDQRIDATVTPARVITHVL